MASEKKLKTSHITLYKNSIFWDNRDPCLPWHQACGSTFPPAGIALLGCSMSFCYNDLKRIRGWGLAPFSAPSPLPLLHPSAQLVSLPPSPLYPKGLIHSCTLSSHGRVVLWSQVWWPLRQKKPGSPSWFIIGDMSNISTFPKLTCFTADLRMNILVKPEVETSVYQQQKKGRQCTNIKFNGNWCWTSPTWCKFDSYEGQVHLGVLAFLLVKLALELHSVIHHRLLCNVDS